MSETNEQPTEPGFYYCEGSRQVMVHLLGGSGQWWTAFDNGEMSPCQWGYIEQSTGVFPLRHLDADTRPGPAAVRGEEVG